MLSPFTQPKAIISKRKRSLQSLAMRYIH